MPKISFLSAARGIAPAALSLMIASSAAYSQVVIAPSPKVGSTNPVSAEAPTGGPDTTPCVVHLFTNHSFTDYTPYTFSYAPPVDCPGPWAKVVFTADFTVSKGVQFDRTASIYLGHANIYYGTTAEPSSNVSPSWHVESNVTNLTPIFLNAQKGEADIFNIVDSTYTGIIYADAALKFYPASSEVPVAEAPDVVVPMPDADGGAAFLYTSADQLSQKVKLPPNTERVYLKVIAQSQSADEFWYTCVPSDVTGALESCGNTAFRETEVSVDGVPAGVAPVYPWIYTGGIDPFLWSSTPGVQTFDFKPYTVDLTPFAALFADGQEHTVALSVFNSDSYFLVTGNLVAFVDHGKNTISGELVSNNLTAEPIPTVSEQLNLDANGLGTAAVSVISKRNYAITGFVLTSQGKVTTTVAQEIDFKSLQNFTLSDSSYIQDINQNTNIITTTTTLRNSGKTVTTAHVQYPLKMNIDIEEAADGSSTQATRVDQLDTEDSNTLGPTPASTAYYERVIAYDTLNFDPSGNFTGNTGQKSSAVVQNSEAPNRFYMLEINASNGKLTKLTKP